MILDRLAAFIKCLSSLLLNRQDEHKLVQAQLRRDIRKSLVRNGRADRALNETMHNLLLELGHHEKRGETSHQ